MNAVNARIGITTSLEEDPQEGDQQTLRLAYVRAVERAGGLPLLVPMLESERATRAFASLLDGLIVTGGPAVTEGLLTDGLAPGELPSGAAHPLPDDLSGNARVRRRSDGWLLDAFDETERPVLGICYGMQLLSVRRGARIWADVERQAEGAQRHSQKRGAGTHPVIIREGTHLRRLLGRARAEVNTRHVQALASAGRGLRVSATAPDGVIEAVESRDGRLVGVQFHPERLDAAFQPLFHHLVEHAEQARTASSGAVPASALAGAQDG